jgi:hypothetical protein
MPLLLHERSISDPFFAVATRLRGTVFAAHVFVAVLRVYPAGHDVRMRLHIAPDILYPAGQMYEVVGSVVPPAIVTIVLAAVVTVDAGMLQMYW